MIPNKLVWVGHGALKPPTEKLSS